MEKSIIDTRKETAVKIITDICALPCDEIMRFTAGYCHSVYYVRAGSDEYVLRITGKENERFYRGSLKWLPELHELGAPVPEIVKYGEYGDVLFALITHIKGRDFGDVYNTLKDAEKAEIAKSLSDIQRKVSSMVEGTAYGYSSDEKLYATWADYLYSLIDRSAKRIVQNEIFAADICDRVRAKVDMLSDYLSAVRPTAFLGDITTKNVLIYEGRLSGIVDVDEICYGDTLLVIGLTNMALLKMKADTNYIDYWLDEVGAGETQRRAVLLYTLIFCIDFMSEQGLTFDNGSAVPGSAETVETLTSIYTELSNKI